MANDHQKSEIILSGISASPGICIGKAYIVDREGVDVIKRYRISQADVKNEINRFKTAVKQAKAELNEIIANTPEGLQQHSDILQTHVVLLEDKMIFDRTVETINNDTVNA